MILNESEEHAVRFSNWLSQIKAANTRLTLTIESSRSELASEEDSATSDMYVALLRAKIKMMNEDALKMQTECDFIFTETIVMIEGFDCGVSGEQLNEQRRYIAEIKEEWRKEKERYIEYRDYLAEAAKRLAGSSSQGSSRTEVEEKTSQWMERRDLDPGPIPKEMSKLE